MYNIKAKLTKKQEKQLLKLSPKEIIEIINNTLEKYWFHKMEFFKIGLEDVLNQKKLEEEIKQIEKEQQDFEKASKEYQDFMNEMFDKYGAPLNLIKLNCEELKKFTTLYNTWKKECLKGIKQNE